jgi:pimeloyl-ACP methyl ester carboxylesterase
METRLQPTTADYASVNGLNLYYEIYGSNQSSVPLILMHGGMTTNADFGFVLPALAQSRQVIAFERQGHGHTADIDRPFTLDNWADDTAALLKHLKIEQADVFGYSTGGSVALAFALRYPKLLRKLVVASALHNPDGYYPGIMEGLKHAKATDLPPIMREMYEAIAPRPQDWAKLVEKSVASVATFKGWSKKDLRTISAPTMVLVGDNDIVRTEHAVELYRLISNAKLAILPETDHVSILIQRAAWVGEMITEFLNATINTEHSQAQQTQNQGESDFPKSIGRPATGALLEAGYTHLEQLTRLREIDVKHLHGVGPKAVRILREALAEKGWSFAE